MKNKIKKWLYLVSALPVVVLLIVNAAEGRLVGRPPMVGFFEDYPALWLTGVGMTVNTIIWIKFNRVIFEGQLYFTNSRYVKYMTQGITVILSLLINHTWVISQLNNGIETWFSVDGHWTYIFTETVEKFNTAGVIFYLTCVCYWFMMVWLAFLLMTSGLRYIIKYYKGEYCPVNGLTYLYFASGVVLSFTIYYVSLQINDLFIEGLVTFELHPNRSILLLVAILLWMTLVVLISFFQKKYDKVSVKKIYHSNLYVEIGAIVFPFLVITLVNVSLVNYKSYEVYSAYAFFSFILLLIVIGFLALYEYTKGKRIELTNRLAQTQEELMEYTGHVERLYRDVRTFKHDHHNIVLAINGYLKDENLDGLRDFMKETEEVQSVSAEYQMINKLILLERPGLKSVLMSKLTKCSHLGIEVSLDVQDLDIQIDEVDLVRVVGNLLDNAIEATESLNDKFIFVGINKNEVVVGNRYQGKINPESISTFGYSSKGHNRGIGLYSLKHIVKKYDHIQLKTEISKDLFTQKITQQFS